MSTSTPIADALSQVAAEINTRRPLPDVLQDLVHMACRSLPGVDHAGISITHADGTIETVAATDELVHELDQLQYELDEGPCLRAIREESVVVINYARTDERWPLFIKAACARGLRSQMGLRLYSDEQTLAGLNLYSTATDELDHDTVHIAQLFAGHAALALGKARLEENLLAGMGSRQRIGVAMGIVMQRYGLDESRAFQYLARVSQTSNTKLRDIADEIVDDANKAHGVPQDRRRSEPAF